MQSLAELYGSMMQSIYGSVSVAEDFIVGSTTLDAQVQLGIYQSSVKGGLAQALADIFPAVKGTLGSSFFGAMALRYVADHPSHAASLDLYGAQFPGFVERFEPLKSLPFMADLAQLEWMWHCAFHCENSEPFDVERLARVKPEHADLVEFSLVEPLFLLRSEFPLLKLWALGKSPDPASSEDVDIGSGGGCFVVYREGLDVRLDEVPRSLFDFLMLLKKPRPFGTICEEWLSKHPAEGLDAQITELIARSWIANFLVPSMTIK